MKRIKGSSDRSQRREKQREELAMTIAKVTEAGTEDVFWVVGASHKLQDAPKNDASRGKA